MIERFSFKRQHLSRTLFVIFNAAFLFFIVLVIVIPFLKVVSDSFDQQASVITFRLWPSIPTVEAYLAVLRIDRLYTPFLISVGTTIVGTLISITFTTLFAYGLAKKELPFRRLLMGFVLVPMVFKAGIVPLFLIVKWLGLYDTLFAVIIVHCIDAYYLILMKNFFSTIHKDLIDASEIDGCSPLQTFLRIVLPLSKPGVAAISLFYIVHYWNMFFDYIIFISNENLMNFQVRVRTLIITQDTGASGFERAAWDTLTLKNAVIVITIVPVMIIYPLLQRYFVTGINLGALKE